MIQAGLSQRRYPISSDERRFGERSDSAVVATRWLFAALCLNLIAQAFTVPLIALGHWTLWPTLPDIAVGLSVAAWVVSSGRFLRPTKAQRAIARGLVAVVIGCAISFLISTLATNLTSPAFGAGQRFNYGAFALLRLVEFALLFGLAAVVPLTPGRITILRRVTLAALLLICAGIIATSLGIVDTGIFMPFLPEGPDLAGQWHNYRINYYSEGLGTLGYNHHFVAAQVVVFLGLYVGLRPRLPALPLALMLALTTTAVFVTGSRAVLAAHLVFVIVLLMRRSLVTLAVVGLLALLAVLTPGALVPEAGPATRDVGGETGIVERQLTTLRFYESETLSGRDLIWRGKLDRLVDEPRWWLLGRGLGAAVDTGYGTSSHMLVLQLVVEIGVVGLVAFVVLVAALLRILWRAGSYSRPIFWMTAALLLTSATYETFYPIPSMQHFLGLYLCVVAITIRLDASEGADRRMAAPVGKRPGYRQPMSAGGRREIGPTTLPARSLSTSRIRATSGATAIP